MRNKTVKTHYNQDLIDAFTDNRELLKNIAFSYVQNNAVAEDLIQDAITKVLEISLKAENNEIENPKAYLITAVRNRAFNFLSSSEKKTTSTVDNFVLLNVLSDEPLQDTVLEDREKLKVFVAAYESLPAQCKRVLLMKKVHGLSLKETADTLGISVSTVQKHLTKALTRCAIYMAEAGYD